MSRTVAIVFAGLLCLVVGLAGCLDEPIGQVTYDGEQLVIEAHNDGAASQAVLEVKVYRVEGLGQTEIFSKAEYVQFDAGANEFRVPVTLGSGTYKAYVYLSTDSGRRGSVIRDLSV
jgi:hypothetical protein